MNVDHLALMILEQAKKNKNRNALFYKKGSEWKPITWKEMGDEIAVVAQGLLEFGIGQGDTVGIFSHNRPEWAISDYGIMSVRAITVPIYTTNTAAQTEYVLNDAGIKVIFLDGQYQYDCVEKYFISSRSLKKIVVFNEDVKIMKHPDVMYYRDFLSVGRQSGRGAELDARLSEVEAGDTSTIIYTSGTTGDPKGAELSHAHFFTVFRALNERFRMGEGDIELCFLPLSHAYAKASGYWVQSKGASVYYCDDPKKIIEYFQETRPTYMVGVPRLYEKMYAAINERVEKSSGPRKAFFRWAIHTGREYRYRRYRGESISPLLRARHIVAYRTVLRRIRSVLGGRVNFFSAGGAPLSREIEEFFFAANIFIAQGYGLTETSPMITCNYPGKFKFGTPGTAIPGCEIRIDDDGEVLVRGANLMKGYYKKPEATREAIGEDGWFRTGDIGYLDKEGFLHITDRKKDIIVTAGGKNVAPQGIESLLGQDFYIEQIAVVGDRRKYITALIVPAFEALEEYARSQKIAFSSREDLVSKPEILDFYRQRIDGMSTYLAKFEKIVRFALLPREFSQHEDELTPTSKIKRRVIEEHFRDIIDKMYEE